MTKHSKLPEQCNRKKWSPSERRQGKLLCNIPTSTQYSYYWCFTHNCNCQDKHILGSLDDAVPALGTWRLLDNGMSENPVLLVLILNPQDNISRRFHNDSSNVPTALISSRTSFPGPWYIWGAAWTILMPMMKYTSFYALKTLPSIHDII